MFGQLQNKFARIFKTIKGHGKITDSNIKEAIREIRIALLESDVNFQVVKTFIDRIKNKVSGTRVFDSITPGQQFVKIVLDELIDFLKSEDSDLNINNNSLTTIVLSGLQGSGKTTTSVKLACFLKREKNKKPLLLGLDIKRPAAMEQLKILAKSNDIDYYIEKDSIDPINVLKNGIKKSKELKLDVIIIDTAGRLHIDEKLIKQLQSIIDLSNPEEVLYIADGMTGQDAVNSSKVFVENCKVTGCIITKMDGDSGGGVALSIKEVTNIPIKYIASGENINDFEKFNSDRISRRILGLDDVIGLVENAQKTINIKDSEKLKEKFINNQFDLNDFKNQIDQFSNFGNINQMMKYIPKMKKNPNLEQSEDKIKWIKAIIDSMTKHERTNPEIINGSRKKRISSGCGRPIYEINQLLKQFNQMKTMMKKISGKGFNKFPFKI